MPDLDRLPGPEDGVTGLLRLADLFGDEEVFKFLGWIRQGGAASQPPGQARAALAHRMVEREGGDPDTARRIVAERLGYTDKTRTNFYKLADGTTRDGRPITDS